MSHERESAAAAEAALRDSEEKYRFLAEALPIQIWTSRPDGNLDYVSNQTASVLGLSPERLLADGWQNVVHPDDLGLAIEMWTRALTTGEPYEVEFRLKLGSGAYAWHLARAVPQRDGAGKIVRWCGTNTNIEDRRSQQSHVEALLARLEQKNHILLLEAEIGSIIKGAQAVPEMLRACTDAIVRHLEIALARVWISSQDGTVLELRASAGLYSGVSGPHERVLVDKSKIGQVALQKSPFLSNNISEEPLIGDRTWVLEHSIVGFYAYPIVFQDGAVGVLAVFAKQPFSDAVMIGMGAIADAIAEGLRRREVEENLKRREAWLSTTLSSIGDGVIATDRFGVVTYLNPVASALTAWSSDEAAGHTLEEVFPLLNEETRAPVESPVAKVIREGTIVGLANHTILIQKGGKEIPIDDSAAPIRDHDGSLRGVVMVFRDAGEKRRADNERAELLEREQRARAEADSAQNDLHSMFMQSPSPICILRGAGHTFALANSAYANLIGPHRKLVGLTVREALPELEGQGFYELLDGVYKTGKTEEGREVPVKLARGGGGAPEDAFVNFTYQAFRDVEGVIAGILVSAFDVTEMVRARQTVQASLKDREGLLARAEEARRKADAANRAKDEFLTIASHELRTPLNAILGWARLLRSGSADPSAFIRGLETIERNAVAQVKLIEDILDGSRIITGKLHLEMRSIDLVALVQTSVESVSPAATAKNITLTSFFDPRVSRMLGDPDRLQQIVWNLVNNALKFTPKGGAVNVRLQKIESAYHLIVKDNGKGIDPEFLPHVFERFQQEDASSTRRHGGLGLGLALVRHLAEAHGGTVRAESGGAGLGSTFTIALPVQAVVPEDVEAFQIRMGTKRAAGALSAASLQGVVVLVVDDEPDARDVAATLLRAHGAEVWTAGSAALALAALERGTPHIILSDIGMPVTDGHSLMERVRALDSAVAKIPSIALTAYAREEDRRLALAAGFDDYFAKPADAQSLVRTILKLVRPAMQPE